MRLRRLSRRKRPEAPGAPRLEGSRFSACRRRLAYSFQCEEGKLRVKQAAPANLPSAMFCPAVGSITPFHSYPRDKPRVGSFAGAACLKKFAVIRAPRKIARGPLGAIQSGSPPLPLVVQGAVGDGLGLSNGLSIRLASPALGLGLGVGLPK